MKRIVRILALAVSMGALGENGFSTHGVAENQSPKSDSIDYTGQPSGNWEGSMELEEGNRKATIEIEFTKEGTKWRAKGKITRDSDNQKLGDVKADLKVDGARLSFTCSIEDAEVRFSGKLTGEKIKGSFEALANGKVVNTGPWELTRKKKTPAKQ